MADIGTRATLDSQIRQLEHATGHHTAAHRPGRDPHADRHGEQFARDVAPVLDMLAVTEH